MTAYTNPEVIPANPFNRFLFYLFVGIAVLILVLTGYLVFHTQIKRILNRSEKSTLAQPILQPVSIPLSGAIRISCPTVSSFCSKDGTYTKDSLSGKLLFNTPIYAVFDGTAEGLVSFHPLEQCGHEEFP